MERFLIEKQMRRGLREGSRQPFMVSSLVLLGNMQWSNAKCAAQSVASACKSHVNHSGVVCFWSTAVERTGELSSQAT